MTPPVSPKGKPFTWSYSAINDFDTCPYQYAAKRFYETVKFEDTEATLWGTRVHTAMEQRLRDKVPLPEDMKHWEKYCSVIESRQGELHVEKQICIARGGELVDWFAPNAWGRGVVDVLIIDGDTAFIYDWKTGKMRDSQLQLQLFAWFVSRAFPDVTTFVTRFIWLNNYRTSGEEFTTDDLPAITETLAAKLERMELAWKLGVFQPKESGLCRGWCPVEECRHWREKRR